MVSGRVRKQATWLMVFLLFWSVVLGVGPVKVNANELPDGTQYFTGYKPINGIWSSPDGFFQVSSSHFEVNADEFGAFINNSTDIQKVESYLEIRAINNLGSFKLSKVIANDYVDGGTYGAFDDIIIKGYVNGIEVFASESFSKASNVHYNEYPLNVSSITGYSIDSFRVYYTKLAGTKHTHFNLASFQIADASVDDPPAPVSTYTVRYDGNGDTGGTVPTDENRYAEGDNVTVKSNSGNLVKTGYTFDGWNTQDDGLGTDYTPGASFAMGTTNVVLYAMWAENLTYSISEISDQSFSNLMAGYPSGTQEEKTITVTRTGTGDLDNLSAVLSGSDASSFTLTQPADSTLNAGTPSTTFTVKAKDGLGAGTYTATVTVSATNMTDETFTVTQVVNAAPTYSIETLPNQTLTALTAGYVSGSQEEKTITVTRTGTGDLDNLSAVLSGSDASSFTLTQPVESTLNNSTPSTTFMIKAKDGLAAGTYTATITVSATNMADETFTVTQVVGAAPTYTIDTLLNQTLTELTAGYPSGSQEEKTITVTRTGTGDLNNLSAVLSGTDASSFALTQPVESTLNNSTPSTTFMIKAKDGLVAGTYTATVTVSATNMTDETFTVTQIVNAAPTYTIDTLSNQTLTALTAGYVSGSQEEKTIPVTRTGTGDLDNLSAALSGSDASSFTLTQPADSTLNAGTPSTTFTVKAKDGLGAGTYTATVTVSATNMTDETFTVTQIVNAAPTYTIDTLPNQTLTALTAGYVSGSQEEKTITVIRTGTGDLNTLSASLSGSDASSFALTQPVESTLNNSTPSTTFMIKAKDGLVAGTYTATVTVSATNMTDETFTVTQIVNAAPTYTIETLPNQTLTALTAGYVSGSQEEITIPVTRTGTGDLDNLSAALSGSDASSFTLTQPADSTLNAGKPTTTFTVKAKDGLGAGTYTATVTVSATNMTDETFLVTQVVGAAPTYTINTLSNQTLTELTLGYPSGSQEEKMITVTRTGTGDLDNLSAALSGADALSFTMTQPADGTLNNSTPSTTFTIKAQDGLAAGTYTATVTISATHMTDETFTVKQVVKQSPPIALDITAVQPLSPIRNVENGTSKTADALGLPDQVEAILNDGTTVDVDVRWNLDDADYDPQIKEEQSFTVIGALRNLPNGVSNSRNVTASIRITVNAAEEETGDIVAVIHPSPINGVANGTAKTASALGLPEEVEVELSNGKTTFVRVDWDLDGTSYDPENEEAQKFRITGTLVLSNGITNSKGKTASIQVSVKAASDNEEELDIVEVVDPKPIKGIENGTKNTAAALGLPKKVKTILDNESTLYVEVKWEVEDADYDPSSSHKQEFSVEGRLVKLPDGVTNSQNLTVHVQVTVNKAIKDNDRDDDRDSRDREDKGGGGQSEKTKETTNDSKRYGSVDTGKDSTQKEQVEITRNTSDTGRKVDEVDMDTKKIRDILENALENQKDKIRILISDLPNDPADEVTVRIPERVLDLIKEQNVSIEIKTGDVSLIIQKEILAQMSGDELYFRVVPIHDPNAREITAQRTILAAEVQQIAGGQAVQVIGKPMEIETNYSNRQTSVLFPLDPAVLPADPAKRQGFLASLFVYVEHSDGEKELKSGVIRYDELGNVIGIEIEVDKFSTFTIVSLNVADPSQTYTPNHEMTRAEIAVMISRMLQAEQVEGSESVDSFRFLDIAEAFWAANAIQQVNEAGLMIGDANGMFHPDAKITRAEMATIIAKWKGYASSEQQHSFADAAGHWAEKNIAAVKEQGIMKGYMDGTFRPNQSITQSEAAILLHRVLEKAANSK